jgi:geranylgeranyl pyrophosphate synthase
MLDIAVAIELIHTYSLIHDDLPAMDDDDMRRHKPACHKRFTEATAILAGDALLTYAFEILSGNEHFCAQVKCQMINGVAKAIGCFGMAGGQDLDLRYKNSQISLDKILEIQSLKTGKLFEICIDLAIIASGNSGKSCQILQQYAKNFGIIFQIKDDIEDYEKNLQNLSEVNIVKILGLSSSKIKLEELRNDASLILSQNFPRNLFSELLWI